jgi:hypothetical protein
MSSPLRGVHESLWIIPTDEFISFTRRPSDVRRIHFYLAVLTSSQQEDISETGQLGLFAVSQSKYETRHHRWVFSGLALLPNEGRPSSFRLKWDTDPMASTGSLEMYWI